MQAGGLAVQVELLDRGWTACGATVDVLTLEQAIGYPIGGILVHLMAGGVGELVRDGDLQKLVGGDMEQVFQMVRAFGVGAKESLFEKRGALFEGAEGRAALVETKTQQERLPILGTDDDPAPGAELRRVAREHGFKARRVLKTGNGIVSGAAKELLAGA